jgi:hypothetical protein
VDVACDDLIVSKKGLDNYVITHTFHCLFDKADSALTRDTLKVLGTTNTSFGCARRQILPLESASDPWQLPTRRV